jgi:F-type H+-transporting ATPase subunit epsilon
LADSTQVFQLKVLSPDKKYYQGQAVSLSAANKAGPFDILAQHTHFFSLLTPGSVSINTGSEQIDIPIASGIVKVADNNVTLFVNI